MRPLQQNDVFHAIAHPARRTILVLLKGGEKPASELAEPFGVSFAAISQHLKILKEVASWAEEFETFWNAKLDALTAHLDRKHGRKTK